MKNLKSLAGFEPQVILSQQLKPFSHRYFLSVSKNILDTDLVIVEKIFDCFRALFPCGDAMVCIIDDREDVWHFSPNLIHVKPYRFFQGTADINAPPGLTKTEHDNEALVHRVRKISQSSTGSNGEKSDGQSKTENQNEKSGDAQSKTGSDNDKSCEQSNEKSDKEKSSEEPKTETNQIAGNESENVESGKESDNCETKMETGDESKTENIADHKISSNSVTGDDNDSGNESDKGIVSKVDTEIEKGKEVSKMETNESLGTETGETDKSSKQDETKTDQDCEDKKEVGKEETDNKEDVELIEWDDEDDYLFYLEEILKTIHSAFYKFYDQIKDKESKEVEKEGPDKEEKPSLKNLIPYIKKKALKGCNVVFSGVIPTNMPAEKSRAYIVAKSLGANIHTEFKSKHNESNPEEYTTHLVAARPGTSKVRTAVKYRHVKKVSPEWLWCCSERWERVEESLFPIPPASETDEQGRESPDVFKLQKEMKRKRQHESVNDTSENDSKRMKKVGSTNSLGKDTDETEFNDNDVETDQLNGSGDKEKERNFSMSYNPMLAFSDDDLAYMDKEVENEMDEDDNESSEDDELRESRIRKQVLKQKGNLDDSSSEDSLSGDTPRGWGLKKKMSPKSSSDEEMKGSNSPDHDLGPEYESETDQDKFDKIMDAFGPESENSDDEYAESIGSVDEEIADAVVKEFLS